MLGRQEVRFPQLDKNKLNGLVFIFFLAVSIANNENTGYGKKPEKRTKMMDMIFKKKKGEKAKGHGQPFIILAVMALGVVYGDIGTSPLYALNEVFFGPVHVALTPENIYGAIGLIVWLLTIIVTLKYIVFVLRAEYEGNGGVFSLLGIVQKIDMKSVALVCGVLVLSAGLLFGEGIITPAISVLSAVEGLKVATPLFDPYIIPITLAVLTAIFSIQYKGTKKVGTVFGPIMIVWFSVLAFLGYRSIALNPAILYAFNPVYIWGFITSMGLRSVMFVLGSALLAVTGVEALYADLGHFGKGPIRASWLAFVYPALILNYLGQGAYLLSGDPIRGGNLFYSLVPQYAIYPMVILATFATVIASQALISGAYSLIAQAIALNYSPRLKIDHKNEDHEGQIYVAAINWTLFAGCVSLVLLFRSSSNLAAAYGLAVSGVMFVTSLTMIAIARYNWKWSREKSILVFGSFALFESFFLLSNSLKFLEGGYIPIIIGFTFFTTMIAWHAAKKMISRAYADFGKEKNMGWLIALKKRVEEAGGMICDERGRFFESDRAVIFLVSKHIRSLEDSVPPTLRVSIKRDGCVPKYVFLLNICKDRRAYLSENKHDIVELGCNIFGIQTRCGFMEQPDVKDLMEEVRAQFHVPFDVNRMTIRTGDEILLMDPDVSKARRAYIRFYRFLNQISIPAYRYFGLGSDFNFVTTFIPIHIHKRGASVQLSETEVASWDLPQER